MKKGVNRYSVVCAKQKWVYRTPAHVMVCVDTNTDLNVFLMIFDASKECTNEAMRAAWEKRW